MKRAIDIVAAAAGLLLAAPVMLAVAFAIRLSDGAPVIFRHRRAGRGGVPFTLLKFRTMTTARDATGEMLPDGARITRLGARLRATSLDELPQFWNVLRGDMSLIGPRPLLLRYTERYSPRQRRRLEVRPGITGLAQVSGRNALDWDDRLELDVRYVETCGLATDLTIVLRTIGAVLSRRGVSAAGHATMPEFMGPISESSIAPDDEARPKPGSSSTPSKVPVSRR